MTANGGAEKLRFPVLPERVNVRKGITNQSVTIQGLGEVVIMQDAAATVITFSCFFPVVSFPGVQFDNLVPPLDIVDQIERWGKGDSPVQFIVTCTNLNQYFTIESFNYHEQGGDVDTLHYSITLKECKQVYVRQVNIENDIAIIPSLAPKRVDNRAQPLTHIVVRGDNLTAIARRHLGNGARWQEIFELNRDIVSNANLIFPGQVLRLPAA
jgi:nucleoid-associated protein YgaU